MDSNPGDKIPVTKKPDEKRFIEDPLREYYKDLLQLDDDMNPKSTVQKIIKKLRNGKTEAGMKDELSKIYPELKKSFIETVAGG